MLLKHKEVLGFVLSPVDKVCIYGNRDFSKYYPELIFYICMTILEHKCHTILIYARTPVLNNNNVNDIWNCLGGVMFVFLFHVLWDFDIPEIQYVTGRFKVLLLLKIT